MCYGPSHKSPFMRVISACRFGDEPAVSDQDRGCVDCGFWVPEGGGAELSDISHPDDFFIPVSDDPIEQSLCCLDLRRGFLRFLGWCWPPLIQSFKEVHRCQSSYALSAIAAGVLCGVASMTMTSPGSGSADLSLLSAERSIVMMNLSAGGAACGPGSASASKTLAESILCFADAPGSHIMPLKMSGAFVTSCWDFSRFAAPLLTL